MEEKKSLIILSGGMDSVTLLYDKAQEIALAVTFDYGSNHNKREAECAAYHCEKLGIEHIIIPLDFIHQYFNHRFWRVQMQFQKVITQPRI